MANGAKRDKKVDAQGLLRVLVNVKKRYLMMDDGMGDLLAELPHERTLE